MRENLDETAELDSRALELAGLVGGVACLRVKGAGKGEGEGGGEGGARLRAIVRARVRVRVRVRVVAMGGSV